MKNEEFKMFLFLHGFQKTMIRQGTQEKYNHPELKVIFYRNVHRDDWRVWTPGRVGIRWGITLEELHNRLLQEINRANEPG